MVCLHHLKEYALVKETHLSTLGHSYHYSVYLLCLGAEMFQSPLLSVLLEDARKSVVLGTEFFCFWAIATTLPLQEHT